MNVMEIEQLGPYRIERTIGRGGMGTVFAAVDENTQQRAAVKVLAPALASDETFCSRFISEIESLKKLTHPNIVQLFGYGQHEGHLFYAMEMVDGKNLQEEIQDGRRFQWREVARIGIEVCKALKHAHDCGVIHRDLKPANLLLDEEDCVKLTDFGIARLFGATHLTTVGDVLGTVDYMAPEQAMGQAVTPRCDLYSLGSVLYALLAGRPPFRSDSMPRILQMLQFDEPVPIGRRVAETPAELDRIIMQLLSKDPEERIPTPKAVARRLEAMIRALSIDKDDAEAAGDETSSDDGAGASVVPISEQETVAPPPDGIAPSAPPTEPTPFDVTGVWQGEEPADEEPETPLQETPAPESHFTTVEEARRRAEELRAEQEKDRFLWPKMAGTAVVVALIVLAAWYALRPLSADRLHQRIEAAAEEGSIEQLAEAENDIRRFIERFPDDPRREEVEDYLEQIELDRLDRNFQRRARRQITADSHSAVEQAYLEAVHLAAANPEAAAVKLAAIVDVYGDQNDAPEITQQCVALARRRLAQLRESIDRFGAEHAAELMQRLDEADRLQGTDPDAADAIRRGIIELYADKPWAGDAIRRAREALGRDAS